MKQSVATCLFLALTYSLTFSAKCQVSADSLIFDQAIEASEEQNHEKSIKLFKLLVSSYPHSAYFGKALYNIAYLYFTEFEELDSAEEIFTRILSLKLDERDKGGQTSSPIHSPYSLYKHNSSKRLCEIYLQRKDYEQALRYIKLADRKYNFEAYSGTDERLNYLYETELYYRCYVGLNKIDRAYKVLRKAADTWGFYMTQELIMTAEIKFGGNRLRMDLEKGLNNLEFALTAVYIPSELMKTKLYYHIQTIPELYQGLANDDIKNSGILESKVKIAFKQYFQNLEFYEGLKN